MERFDRSFAIRMIRDFLLALTAIVVLELGGRFALAAYRFETHDRKSAELAAERLATNVKDIMLNRGGPVAARTVYPILRRNYDELGYEIAITPSPLTVESIERSHGFTPRGVPPDWSEGRHHEAVASLRAEPFCVSCHVTARPGDVLGRVTVRAYRADRLREWWAEARIISVVGMGTVILHTVVLFLLLRVRMQPLLELRDTVAELARGRLRLDRRAAVRSDDEFGNLARDLNHFLDRVRLLLDDLEDVLGKVMAVNSRLERVSRDLGGRVESFQSATRKALRATYEIRGEIAGNVQAASRLDDLGGALDELSGEFQDDSHYLGEIRVLEERMRIVAESGRSLLARLTGPGESPADERSPDG